MSYITRKMMSIRIGFPSLGSCFPLPFPPLPNFFRGGGILKEANTILVIFFLWGCIVFVHCEQQNGASAIHALLRPFYQPCQITRTRKQVKRGVAFQNGENAG